MSPLADQSDAHLSIVAVPAIGAHHRKPWTAHGSHCWLESDLLGRIPRARVLLYDHRELRGQTIDSLGHRLLSQLVNERRHQVCDCILY